ncbi:hypothetical protein DFJ74DRAFT_714282 [Hyaloraphidium curvatum]|nr:hypothetical protein DFJ74DRAFT_714282 [Hyaloraphidium curvatum]
MVTDPPANGLQGPSMANGSHGGRSRQLSMPGSVYEGLQRYPLPSIAPFAATALLLPMPPPARFPVGPAFANHLGLPAPLNESAMFPPTMSQLQASAPLQKALQNVDISYLAEDESLEEEIEPVPDYHPPKRRKTGTESHLLPEAAKDWAAAIERAKRYIDSLSAEWDELDSFTADDDDLPAPVMVDADRGHGRDRNGASSGFKHFFVVAGASSKVPLMTGDTLRTFIDHIDRINEGQKMKELGQAVEGGNQTLLKIMQWVDNWAQLPEAKLSLDSGTAGNDGDANGDGGPADGADDGMVSAADFDAAAMDLRLQCAKLSADAAYVALAIMVGGAGKIDRKIYSEDLIMSMLELLKHHLQHTIYPYLGSGKADDSSASVKWIARHRALFEELAERIGFCLTKLGDLFSSREGMDETVVISATFAGVAPFFAQTNGDGSRDSSKGRILKRLQLASMDLIRAVFAHYPGRRLDIFADILSSLGSLATHGNRQGQGQRYLLPDGRSISMWSALILECLQSTCEMTESRANSLVAALEEDLKQEQSRAAESAQAEVQKTPSKRKKGKQKADAAPEVAELPQQASDAKEPHFGRLQELLRTCLDAAATSASFFMHYLTSRALPVKEKETGDSPVKPKGKPKGRKEDVNNELEYRSLLESWIADLCIVLDVPEFPVASIAFLVTCKMVGQVLEDSTPGRTAASRQTAMDLLGTLVARLRQRETSVTACEAVADLVTRFPQSDVKDIDQEQHFAALDEVQRRILCFLVAENRKSGSTRSAEVYFLTDWIARLLANASSEADSPSRVTSGQVVRNMFTALLQRLCEHARSTEKIIQMRSSREVDREHASALIALFSLHSSRSVFDTYLMKILQALDQTSNQLRGKALRALGDIVTVDPSVLSLAYVISAVEERILDPGPTVRDASIELVHKYAFKSKDLGLIRQYFNVVAERAVDMSTMVRKRALRFLKDAYLELRKAQPELARDGEKLELTCTIFVSRALSDEEGTVKELALGSVQDCWLCPFSDPSLAAIVRQGEGMASGFSLQAIPPVGRKELLDRLKIIVGTTQRLQDRDLVGDAFTRMLAKDRAPKIQMCRLLVNGLVEEALAGSQEARAGVLSTLHQLARAEPSLAAPFLPALQPFIKLDAKFTASDEQVMTLVLELYRISIAFTTDRDPRFAESLEKDLQTLMSQGNTNVVGAAVPSFCALHTSVTRDYTKISRTLEKAYEILWKAMEHHQKHGSLPPNPKAQAGIYRTLLISGLLIKEVDFDQLRKEDPKLSEALPSFATGSVKDAMFERFFFFCNLSDDQYDSIRARAIESMGHLFNASPQFMLRDDSRALMDTVFGTDAPKLQQQLLGVFRDLLDSEARKAPATAGETAGGSAPNVNRAVLTGNAEELGHAGIIGSVMQTYLDRVLAKLTGHSLGLRGLAFDVVQRTLEQGLVMPATCVPALVAMESCEDRARAAAKGEVEAVLMPLYAIVRGKKAQRNDFLTGLVKLFDVDLKRQDLKAIDVPFLKFVAENLAAFAYEKQEEVLAVLSAINRVVGITATTVVRFIEEHVEGTDALADLSEKANAGNLAFMAATSKCMGMLLVLRKFLQALYKLSHGRVSHFKLGEGGKAQEKPVHKDSKSPTEISWSELAYLALDLTSPEDTVEQLQEFNALMAADFVPLDDDEELFEGAEGDGLDDAAGARRAVQGDGAEPKASKPKRGPRKKKQSTTKRTPKKKAAAKGKRRKSKAQQSESEEEDMDLDDSSPDTPSSPSAASDDD